MRWFLFFMGGVWVIAGVLLLLFAAKAKEISNKLSKNLSPVGYIPLAVGILLAYSASSSRLPWFVVTISLLALAKGIFFIFAPTKKAKPLINWWLKASVGLYRLWGAVALVLGIFFFWRVA